MLNYILRLLGFKREEKKKSELLKTLREQERVLRREVRRDVRRKKIEKKKVKKKERKTGKKRAKKSAEKKTRKDMIVEYLKKRKKPASIEEIAKKVGATEKTARRYLYYLKNEGKVEKKGKGWVAK